MSIGAPLGIAKRMWWSLWDLCSLFASVSEVQCNFFSEAVFPCKLHLVCDLPLQTAPDDL